MVFTILISFFIMFLFFIAFYNYLEIIIDAFIMVINSEIIVLLQNSSLPWILPKKTSGLDLGNFTESISDALGVCISAF